MVFIIEMSSLLTCGPAMDDDRSLRTPEPHLLSRHPGLQSCHGLLHHDCASAGASKPLTPLADAFSILVPHGPCPIPADTAVCCSVLGAPRDPDQPLPEARAVVPVQPWILLHVCGHSPIRAHLQGMYADISSPLRYSMINIRPLAYSYTPVLKCRRLTWAGIIHVS